MDTDVETRGPVRPSRAIRWWIGAATAVGLSAALWLNNQGNEDKISKYEQSQMLPPAAWREFAPPGDGFAVLMPGEPRKDVIEKNVGGAVVPVVSYVGHDRWRSFVVNVFDYSGEAWDSSWTPQAGLEMVETWASVLSVAAGGRVVLDRTADLYGMPGREVVLEDSARNRRTQTRILLADRRCYMLQCIGLLADGESPQDGEFLSSFRLLTGLPARGNRN